MSLKVFFTSVAVLHFIDIKEKPFLQRFPMIDCSQAIGCYIYDSYCEFIHFIWFSAWNDFNTHYPMVQLVSLVSSKAEYQLTDDSQLLSGGSWSAYITALQWVSSLQVVWLKSENMFSYGKHRLHFVGCKKRKNPPKEK